MTKSLKALEEYKNGLEMTEEEIVIIENELKVISILKHNIIRNEMKLEWVEDEQQWYFSFSGEVIATGSHKEEFDLLKKVLL